MKKTIVLGASENPARYSYLAVQKLRADFHPVIAVGRKKGKIGDTAVITQAPEVEDTDTVTLYLSRQNQREYYDYILSLHPRRIIFNPGAENKELADLARSHGIQSLEACTLVLLATGQY
jgi:predicted CoA-binding protein